MGIEEAVALAIFLGVLVLLGYGLVLTTPLCSRCDKPGMWQTTTWEHPRGHAINGPVCAECLQELEGVGTR